MRKVGGFPILFLVLLNGCAGEPSEPAVLLTQAIHAHGGREALSKLENLHVVSDVVYKGHLPMLRTIHWRGPQDWSMTLEGAGGLSMRLGIADGRCWRQNQYLAIACAESDELEHQRIAALHGARLLHRLDAGNLRPAPSVSVDGRRCQALRAGDLTLVFDPQSHLLVQIRLADRVDTLSEYREVQGSMVAAHRVLTIGGELDVEETWKEITPGAADPVAIRAPELPHDGLVIEGKDAPRPIASMEIDDPESDTVEAITKLDAFIRRQGLQPSASDAVILTAPSAGSAGSRRWRIGVAVEANKQIAPIEEGGLRLEGQGAVAFLGVFCRGDVAQVYGRQSEMERLAKERDLTPSPPARWEILVSRDAFEQAPAERLSLLRIELQ